MNHLEFPADTIVFKEGERFRFLAHALRQVKVEGLYAEFGVHTGLSLGFIADHIYPHKIYGFDSFVGLPEEWQGLQPGHFTVEGKTPKMPDNVEFVKGWFKETLPAFEKSKVAFLHIDCDLYSSTKTVLVELSPHIQPGTVIVFDEFYNYSNWELHEHKAFQEWLTENNRTFRYLARTEYLEVSVIIE